MRAIGMIVRMALYLAVFSTLAFGAVACTKAQDTSPVAPGGLQAMVVHDALLITLLWQDNADNEESYTVERSTDGPDGPWAVIATLAADSSEYHDGGLEDGVTYWYRVAAVNAERTSEYSNVVSGTATALPQPPTLP